MTSQTCRSWTSRTPGCAASAWPIACGSIPRGAASSSTRGRLADSSDRPGAHHQRGDERARRPPSAPFEARDEHEQAGERGAERRVEVGEHVRARALDVERAPLRAATAPRRRATLTPAPARPTTSTTAPSTSGGSPSRWIALPRDHPGEHEQRGAVDLGREDLRAAEAEREAAAGRPRRQPRGDERERDRAGVREHVRGVGEQRERVGEQARDDLDDHEAEDQPERDAEPAAVGVGRRRVACGRGPPCAVGRARAATARYSGCCSRSVREPVADPARRVGDLARCTLSTPNSLKIAFGSACL